MDALGAAIVEMVPNFGLLPHFDSGPGDVRGAKDDCILCRRYNADIESDLPPVDPVPDEDVGGTRAGARNQTRHFLLRVEGSLKRLVVDVVPNSVVPASTDAVVVLAMHSVVAVHVLVLVAMFGLAGPRIEKGKAQAIAHGGAKRPVVEVEVERRRRNRIAPVPSVGKGERPESRLIASNR